MGTKKMGAPNGLLQRENAFYFQARIPKDCREFFPKAIIREKLVATNRSEAKAEVRQKWVELEAKLERIRQSHLPLKTVLSEEDANHILAASITMRLGSDEEGRR